MQQLLIICRHWHEARTCRLSSSGFIVIFPKFILLFSSLRKGPSDQYIFSIHIHSDLKHVYLLQPRIVAAQNQQHSEKVGCHRQLNSYSHQVIIKKQLHNCISFPRITESPVLGGAEGINQKKANITSTLNEEGIGNIPPSQKRTVCVFTPQVFIKSDSPIVFHGILSFLG